MQIPSNSENSKHCFVIFRVALLITQNVLGTNVKILWRRKENIVVDSSDRRCNDKKKEKNSIRLLSCVKNFVKYSNVFFFFFLNTQLD